MGVTTAYELSRTGHKCIILESHSNLGLETSFKNGSLLCPSLLT
jgi:glycine/D-amino acid oxidase-like deaminating enzyme